MSLDFTRARQYLKEFNFGSLFIEELGWDCHDYRVEVAVDSKTHLLSSFAQKRGMIAFACSASDDDRIPDYPTRRKIERQVAKSVHEHLIVYTDKTRTIQVWQWVKREAGKPVQCREHAYYLGQPGDALIQKLHAIVFSLEEEERLTLFDVTTRVRAGFDVDRVTKRFYDRFKAEHDAFLKFLKGIPDEEMERWYASVMLNRLMFIYFMQKKGFLNSDAQYLRNKLNESRERAKDRFYSDFLCTLFFEGFAQKESDRSATINKLLGKVPFLNGGIFQRHQIEELHGKSIQVADGAFEKLFTFFDQYQWHLDERPLRADNEINPDVLGYIFEKYVNQKQMGAYYTKEDITGYISRNTIIPYLFDEAKKKCKTAFVGANGDSPNATVWHLLQSASDRYIYEAVRRGVIGGQGEAIPENILPGFVRQGMNDPKARMFNRDYNLGQAFIAGPNGENLALPTETWREYVRRRKRCLELRDKLSRGDVGEINDLITLNLDICQFAQDVIENCEDPDLLRAFWHAIEAVTVLDLTCGSGAFLFAALNILEPLYEACLDRMEVFLEELKSSAKKHRSDKFGDFKKMLERVEEHPNRRYFIFKSIIVNNLYGVDIMEEAVEICKLRLFLKLVGQVERAEKIEPLPDIDFNIRAGNTLVGYANYGEVKKAVLGGVQGKFDLGNNMRRIDEKAQDVDRLFALFRQQQTELGGEVTPADKHELRKRLKALEDELNDYLAGEYKVDPMKKTEYERWFFSHKPFHWFIEFYGIMKRGGFDVAIGNPPYLDFKEFSGYTVKGFKTIATRNLYPLIVERGLSLMSKKGHAGLIVPVSSVATEGYSSLQEILTKHRLFFSSFDDRPSHLFDGLDKNTLSILLLSNPEIEPIRHSTRLSRWSAEGRSVLFSLLRYHRTPETILKGCLVKIGSPTEASIWQKLFEKDKQLETSYAHKTKFITYYSRKVNAFLQVLDFVPEVRDGKGKVRPPSEFKELYFSSKDIAAAVFCCFNSTLFRWFMDVVSDGSHVNRREVDNFPFNPIDMVNNFPAIVRFAGSLSKNLKSNSEYRTMNYKHDSLTVECIIPKFAKEIVDDIDCLLGKHYGLTDEELDFIINYDIKYRMGRDSGEEEQ